MLASALCSLLSCDAREPRPAHTPAASDRLPKAVTVSSPPAERQTPSVATDHAVYSALLQKLSAPTGGEHAFGCEAEDAHAAVRIVAVTQPIPSGTPTRDAGWIRELPVQAGPLLAVLRAMNNEPAVKLDAGLCSIGRPPALVPPEVAAPTLWPREQAARHSSGTSPLWWLSRVDYTADGQWALVYAVRVCPDIAPSMVGEAEPGAYETVVLAPLERRAGAWYLHDPLYLDIGLPRLEVSRQ